MTPEQQAEAFLKIAHDFHLGDLPTEQSHPETRDLSNLAKSDLHEAHRVLREVDTDALHTLHDYLPVLETMADAVQETLAAGGRVYLCGCGATGRLSLSVECFVREGWLAESMQERVIAFMAGGDAALVRSIEGFEDYPEYGERQLLELGFGKNDLLIATTEGGETPFVIGATEAAARVSNRKPWFLYCNPDEVLARVAARSKRVLENPAINKANLSVGPMAVAGSTRMQASTVLMLAVALALKPHPRWCEWAGEQLNWLAESLANAPLEALAAFTQFEADVSQAGDFLIYETELLGITVLTDTTERSPTFSLVPFENVSAQKDQLALSYLAITGTTTPEQAWQKLLHRKPRTLDWEGQQTLASFETLMGFDISESAKGRRAAAAGQRKQYHVQVELTQQVLQLVWQDGELSQDLSLLPLPLQHTLIKLLLNAHSTLVMGRLGRYEGNLMTYVKPSNNKLIDRAARYVLQLWEMRHDDDAPSYETIIHQLFRERASLQPGEPIVLKTLAALEAARK